MYLAIGVLPLLGSIIAAFISLGGARGRHPGGSPRAGAEDRAGGAIHDGQSRAAPAPEGGHAAVQHSQTEPEALAPPAAGSRPAELVTTVFLFASMLLAWFAF